MMHRRHERDRLRLERLKKKGEKHNHDVEDAKEKKKTRHEKLKNAETGIWPKREILTTRQLAYHSQCGLANPCGCRVC